MAKYRFFPHTADTKFRGYGKTMEEAFSNAALASTSVITESTIGKTIEKDISAEGIDEKALLYNFLEQFIVLFDTEDFLLSEIKEIEIKKNDKFTLKAKVIGDNDIKKYDILKTIKAVTYSEMEIKQGKAGFMVQVVVDI